MNRLKQVGLNYARQTSAFIRIIARRSKWLISDQHWQEEREEYIGYVRGYVKDLTANWFIQEVNQQENNELLQVYIQRIKEELMEIESDLIKLKERDSIERLERTVSLVYGLLSNVYQEGKVPLSFFTLSQRDMQWYLEDMDQEKFEGVKTA